MNLIASFVALFGASSDCSDVLTAACFCCGSELVPYRNSFVACFGLNAYDTQSAKLQDQEMASCVSDPHPQLRQSPNLSESHVLVPP